MASSWLSVNIGASLTVAFGVLILFAGTIQWFLLGKLVQWVMVSGSRALAIAVLGFYGLWVGAAASLWVAG
jgi:hypothetical protein